MSASGTHDTMSIRQVGSVLWRQRLVCLIVALAVLVGGSALVFSRPRVYQSTSSVALLPVARNPGVLPNYPNLITSLVPTYVQLVSSAAVLSQVAAKLPFPVSETQLSGDVHAESLSNAAVITIVAENRDPVRAQQVAARTTSVFLRQLKGNGVVVPKVYTRATLSRSPAAPRTSLLLGIVVLVAILLALGAGLLWDRLTGPSPAGARNAASDGRVPTAPDRARTRTTTPTGAVTLLDASTEPGEPAEHTAPKRADR